MGKKHASARIKNRIKQQFARSIRILEKKMSYSDNSYSSSRFSKKK